MGCRGGGARFAIVSGHLPDVHARPHVFIARPTAVTLLRRLRTPRSTEAIY